ncbi:hypothetical protein [Bacillus sp. FJAT-27225]|nr:hypothetical protein [Bacillus sp. FJAT-27225]
MKMSTPDLAVLNEIKALKERRKKLSKEMIKKRDEILIKVYNVL